MKKLFALALAVLMIFSVSCVVMADDSSVATEVVSVVVVNGENPAQVVRVNANTGDIILSIDPSQGTFNFWSFYVLKGGEYVPAVENVDYTIVSGSASSGQVTVKPLVAGLEVRANYNGVITPHKPVETSSTSPKTADRAMGAVVLMAIAASCVIISKRKLAK